MRRSWLAWLFAIAVTLFTSIASAGTFTPPPLPARAYLVDQAGALTEPQARRLDRKPGGDGVERRDAGAGRDDGPGGNTVVRTTAAVDQP